MSEDRQKSRIVTTTLILTSLLAGAVAGGYCIHLWWQGRIKDPDFIKQATGGTPGGGRGGKGPMAALVRVDKVSLEEIVPQQPVVGRLHEVRKVTVASEVEGKIVSMDVRKGSPVVGGKTVIATIDKVWLDLAISRQEARIKVFEAQKKKELDYLERVKKLQRKGAATSSELVAQQANYDQKTAELKEAEVTLQELKEKRDRIEIRAPFDGWVTELHAELGQRLTMGSPVVDIVNRGDIYAEMNVPESLVNRLKTGMEIPVTVDPLAKTFKGKIASITPFGSTASRTYPVRIKLSDEGGKLKVGMSVTAPFPSGEKKQRLMVSRDAVLIKPDGAVTWVVDGDKPVKAVPVPVDVITRQDKKFAVKPLTEQGQKLLVDGATVVIEGAERLRPNQAVRFLVEKAPQKKFTSLDTD